MMQVEEILPVEIEILDARKLSASQEPSISWEKMTVVKKLENIEIWENRFYYCQARKYSRGFFIGDSPYVVIGITATDESARHDWRDFQRIKNDVVGNEWEAVELYPAESRLKDPSNRFYLWAVPPGTLRFGLPAGRIVLDACEAIAPQRPFSEPWDKVV